MIPKHDQSAETTEKGRAITRYQSSYEKEGVLTMMGIVRPVPIMVVAFLSLMMRC
jgi:hypothetical protein